MKTNQYSGFHKLTMEQRAQEVAEFAGLTPEELEHITKPGALSDNVADKCIENVICRRIYPVCPVFLIHCLKQFLIVWLGKFTFQCIQPVIVNCCHIPHLFSTDVPIRLFLSNILLLL